MTRVLVCGDAVCDVQLFQGGRDDAHLTGPGTTTREVVGGAGLIHAALKKINEVAGAPLSLAFGESSDPAAYPESHRTYGLWKAAGAKPQVWRQIARLGYGTQGDDDPQSNSAEVQSAELNEDASLIVVDDGALGFRNADAELRWPVSLRGESDTGWLLVKMSAPLCAGGLWYSLIGERVKKTIALVSVEELRKDQARISRGISWERTAAELISELVNNPSFRSLLSCRYLVCTIGEEGALIVDSSTAERRFYLVFDSERIEGGFREDLDGHVPGCLATITASVAFSVAKFLKEGEKGDLASSLQRGAIAGIELARSYVRGGLGLADGPPKEPWKNCPESSELGRTLEALFRTGFLERSTLGSVEIKVPANGCLPEVWTILQSQHGLQGPKPSPLYGMGYRVARFGPRALKNIPYQRFGQLFTVDRSEIEALRNLRNLISRYEESGSAGQPLSFAVFGSPGSGKSFGVKQIAKAVLHEKAAIMTFNLSQFEGPADLIGALHQVRDAVLSGHTPLIFWDEFDSGSYRWLQYLLAPMQDGEFQDGQLTHRLGKAIFVFAGGTSCDFENFGPDAGDLEAEREFKLRKGPDFKSRLAGYLNVLGPNPRMLRDTTEKKWFFDSSDICFPVRRALLMRAMLGYVGKNEGKTLPIDQGLLTAFIELPEFKHGARSMEKLLAAFAGKAEIRRSDLPPAVVMELHADYEDFMGLVERSVGFQHFAEEVAPHIHQFYLDLAKEEKWTPKYSQPFEELPTWVKGDNWAAAMRIPQVLSLVGLRVLPKSSEEVSQALSEEAYLDVFNRFSESLAEAEHEGWMEHKFRNDWRLVPTKEERDDSKRLHNLLVPYSKLREKEKEKDRNAVRKYPEILARAGYEVVQPWN